MHAPTSTIIRWAKNWLLAYLIETGLGLVQGPNKRCNTMWKCSYWSDTERGTSLMAQSHCTEPGPGQVQGLMTGLIRREEPGPIVSYCTSSVLVPAPGPVMWMCHNKHKINTHILNCHTLHTSLWDTGGISMLRIKGLRGKLDEAWYIQYVGNRCD